MKKERRFPTFIGILLLLAAIGAGLYLTNSKTQFSSKASGDCLPVNLQVANVTNTSVDISFTTSSTCLETLSLNGNIISDLRFLNTNQSPSPVRIHYFQPKNLKPATPYTFSLIINGSTYNHSSFRFTTSSTPSRSLPTSNLAWGRVLNPDLKTTSNAIVYLNIPGAAPLSSYITTDGNWSVSLASSFNESKSDWFTPPETPVNEDIIVISDDGQTTQVSNLTSSNNPVPDIIIGQNSLGSTPPPADVGQIGSIAPAQTQKNVDILNPKNGDALNTDKPDFFGTAPLNSTVIIEVHSDVAINGQTQSDTSGTWHWSPPTNLPPGEHTVTAKVQDPATGIWQTITRSFTVLAATDGGPAYSASASATLITPSLMPTNTLAPTPTIETPTPTVITRVAHPSSVSAQPPVTGGVTPTLVIILSALLFFIISLRFIQ